MNKLCRTILSVFVAAVLVCGILSQNKAEALSLSHRKDPVLSGKIVKAVVVMKTPSVIEQGLDPASAQGQQLAASLKEEQSGVSAAVSSLLKEYSPDPAADPLGEADDPAQRQFVYVLNGFSVELPYELLEKVERLNGVDHVFIEQQYSVPEAELVEPDAAGSGYEINANESVARTLVGADSVNSAGYKGEGMTVGILDTGLRTTHTMFKNTPSNPKYTSRINLSGLVATGNTYVSSRIPFAYDYSDDMDNNVGGGHYHGTHVAGIIGGYSTTTSYNGIATQAQLLIFKVFDDNGGGCYDSVLLSALEDVALIKPDVINMSLGSPCGNTYDLPGQDDMQRAYQNVYDNGTLLAISAGNDYYSGYSHKIDAGSPNYGIVGSPSTYPASLSVASCYNAALSSTYMSDFSSWGTTDDLAVKPEITAPGGDVYSAYNTSDSAMVTLSGTSMAAPQVAGCMALLKQYLNDNESSYDLSDEKALINQLFMSTSYLMKRSGKYYSPRKMGSGLIRVDYAVNTPAYLTVEGNEGDRPKIELGTQGNGSYTLTFKVHNLSSSSKTYTPSLVCLTDTVNGGTITVAGTGSNVYTLSPSVSGFNTVTVPAHGEKEVALSFTLSASDQNYMESNYPNGGFIEGYVLMTSSAGSDPVLSLPYLGYYGNYDDTPILDASVLNASEAVNSPVGAFTEYNVEPDPYGYTATEEEPPLLGMNPYDTSNYSYSKDVYPANITTSSTGDTTKVNSGISYISLSLQRNVDRVKVEISDAESGEMYFLDDAAMQAVRYSTSYGPMWAELDWDGTDASGNALPDGTKTNFRLTVTTGSGASESTEFPVTIDNSAPEVLTDGIYTPYVETSGSKKYLHIAVKEAALAKLVLKTKPSSGSARTVATKYYYTDNNGIFWLSFDVTNYSADSYTVTMNDYARFEATQTITPYQGVPDVVVNPQFQAHSLVLSGQIGVRFYLSIPEAYQNENNYMEFRVKDKAETDAFDPQDLNNDGTYFGFTAHVSSIQMAEPVTAVFHYGDNQTIEQTYSVKEYLQAFAQYESSYDQKTKDLIHAIGDYGHYIQPFLSQARGWTIGEDYAEMDVYYDTDGWTEEEAAAILEATAPYAIVRDTGDSDVDKITYALDLQYTTSVYVYLKMKEGYTGSINVTVDGKAAEAEVSGSRYLVKIENISGHKLAEMHQIIIETENGQAEVKVSALSYVHTVLSQPEVSEVNRNAMAALYYYYSTNIAYRNQ